MGHRCLRSVGAARVDAVILHAGQAAENVDPRGTAS